MPEPKLPDSLLQTLQDSLEKKDSGLPLATAQDLARISYGFAYIVLPDLVYRSFEEFLKSWHDSWPMGWMLCDFGCSKENVRTTIEQKAAFKTTTAPFGPNCDGYFVQFPPPPPYPILSEEEFQALIASKQRPRLAPYFAAVIHDRTSGDRNYFTLGQSPAGGTTFRTVTEEGENCNLGPGPEPDLAKFYQHIVDFAVG
ncbi:hypothetical protein CfE428DRAFT_3147 [Chthoniobacter flavus Ellin428]|uniref:Uncharacterized protein n=1 Tax=Chthoniobacter flavus Ellin428 TaxID=497964 RepID=B4D2M2_9BACT|nr:hypothetical protein [Chthoniobacter flavus]EDY19462.1 hypothetical protein CfE428DRAFT_3147 [Chthoniobacter flavus Ellin428]TCO90412.1 hypothetical protein EV701_11035 [Chthoniobacter flavus]